MMQRLLYWLLACLQVVWQYRRVWRWLNPLHLFLAAWTTPIDWATVPVPGVSDFNAQIRDNFLYLFSGRPSSVIRRDNVTSYATTSTTFVDVDSTNLKITLTISSGKALVLFSANCFGGSIANSDGGLDFTVDGTRWGTGFAMGLAKIQQANSVAAPQIMVALVTGLSIGSHIFIPQWRTNSAGTITMQVGDGGAVSDTPVVFAVLEVG